jgi:hypothetical protein
VYLLIQVEDKHTARFVFRPGLVREHQSESCADIDRGCCLTHAAFLVEERQDSHRLTHRSEMVNLIMNQPRRMLNTSQ